MANKKREQAARKNLRNERDRSVDCSMVASTRVVVNGIAKTGSMSEWLYHLAGNEDIENVDEQCPDECLHSPPAR